MCRSPQGPLFFGKSPSFFPYPLTCTSVSYHITAHLDSRFFPNPGQNGLKNRRKQRRNRFHFNSRPWAKFTVSLLGYPKKSPEPSGSGDFQAFWQALAPALSFRAMLFFLKAKVLLWAFPETKFARMPVLSQKLRPIWTANSVRRDTGFQFIPACS